MPRRKIEVKFNQAVKLPNKRTTHITLIIHPGAVTIAPFLNKNTVVMLRQFRPALKKYIYELPAGTLDPHESWVTCAHRELLEETGLKSKKLTKLGSIYPVPGYSTEIIHLYKAEQLTQGLYQPEEYEVIKTIPMTKSKVIQLLKQGKLMDAKSICTLALCGWI